MIALVIAQPAADQRKDFLRARLLHLASHLISKGLRLLLSVDVHGKAAYIVQELRDKLLLHIFTPEERKQAGDEVDVLQSLKNLAAREEFLLHERD